LGSCWILKGDDRRIEEDFTKSIELEPHSYFSHANRGAARLKLGNAKGAVANLEEALRLAPAAWPHREQFQTELLNAREALKK
jgi:tetratricopeptide (TPR) repeat protein